MDPPWLGHAMGLFGDASLHLLLDPSYWRPRIERLEQRPRQLVIFPRPDLERPGIEVLELRLRAHDGERLTALLARSAFAQSGESVRLRPCQEISSCQLDWRAVESGHTDLIFRYPGQVGGRKLEDRVLDVLRIVHAACSIESVDCEKVEFPEEKTLQAHPPGPTLPPKLPPKLPIETRSPRKERPRTNGIAGQAADEAEVADEIGADTHDVPEINGSGSTPESKQPTTSPYGQGERRQKGLPDEFAIAMFFRSRGWI